MMGYSTHCNETFKELTCPAAGRFSRADTSGQITLRLSKHVKRRGFLSEGGFSLFFIVLAQKKGGGCSISLEWMADPVKKFS